jgi:sugar phosphate permease
MRYRWVILTVGLAGQAAYSVILFGVPVLAPELQEHYGVSLAGIGVLLAASSIGTVVTLIPWGLLTDRVGERATIAWGLGSCGAGFLLAATLPPFWVLVGLVTVAGALGAGVNAASGRAVMWWFVARERGLALGVRHTSVPLGGALAALCLPQVLAAWGVQAALAAMGALTLLCAAAAVVWIREPPAVGEEPSELSRPLRDRRLWLLSIGSAFYVSVQIAITGFLVLYLHQERGLSLGAAGAAAAAVHVLGAAGRIGFGALSDRLGARMPLLRGIGLAMAAATAAAALALPAPAPLVVSLLVVAGGLAMCWNGLSFTVAAELAGRRRTGAALGLQQTGLALGSAITPVAFAFAVDATSWRIAFGALAVLPLVGWRVFSPISP